MKKLLALMVALVLMLGLMPAAVTAESDLEPYVIDYYMLTNAVSSDLPAVTDAINAIIQPKFNATVKITMLPWGDWFNTVNTRIPAGEKVDIVFTADWYQYTQSIAKNYFLPLNDLMAEYAAQTMEQLGEVFVIGSQFKGINYGVPTDKELAVNGGFLWNKTLADKYGFEIDPTWKSYADWEPLLQVIKDNEPDILPILTDGSLYHVDQISYVGCDIAWYSANPDDPTLYFMWEADYYLDELRAIRSMFEKGFIPRDAVSAETDYYNNHLQLGDFFLTTQPLKPGKGKSTELMSAALNRDVVYDEFETTPLLVNTTHCGGSMLAIAATSEDPARAMMFINEMHVNPDLTNTLLWGVEGVTYEVVSEDPFRVLPIEGNTWTGAVMGWTLGNIFNSYLAEYEEADKYELLAATKVGIPGHIANGYRFDAEDWLDEIVSINNAMELYARPIRVGAVDTDSECAKLVAAAEDAGLRDFFAAVQADFDAWLAAK